MITEHPPGVSPKLRLGIDPHNFGPDLTVFFKDAWGDLAKVSQIQEDAFLFM